MKVYIAQGSGFWRLVKSDDDTEKNLYWLKKEFLYQFFVNGYIVGTVF